MRKKILLWLFVISVMLSQPVRAVDLDYEHGHFEKIKAPKLEGWFPTHIKLKDGRVLFVYDDAYIFDPKTNQFYDGPVNLNYFQGLDIQSAAGILLPDGQVLLQPQTYHHPMYYNFNFANDVYRTIPKDDSLRNKYPSYFELNKLPCTDQEKLLLPYIRQKEDLLGRYNYLKGRYEFGRYVLLYNPEINIVKRIEKHNIYRLLGGQVLLKDGTVLYFGGKAEGDPTLRKLSQEEIDKIYAKRVSQFEIYNPKTERFSLINVYRQFGAIDWNNTFVLRDGRVFIVSRLETCIYNPKDKTFKSLPALRKCYNFLELADGTIMYVRQETSKFKEDRYGRSDYRKVMGYNPMTNEVKCLGKLIVVRDMDFDMLLLPDGNVMVTGGSHITGTNLSNVGFAYERKVEIFNPKTGTSKLIAKMNNNKDHAYSVILDDGRILFYSTYGGSELYIPKGYEEKNKT